jgi:hypothetical protein
MCWLTRGRASGLFSVAELVEANVFLFPFYQTIAHRAVLIMLLTWKTLGLLARIANGVSFWPE